MCAGYALQPRRRLRQQPNPVCTIWNEHDEAYTMAAKLALSRRTLLGGLGLLGLTGCATTAQKLVTSDGVVSPDASTTQDVLTQHGDHTTHMGNILVGDVDPTVNGFDPTAILTDFDYGK